MKIPDFREMLLGEAAVGRQDIVAARAAFVRALEIFRARGDLLYTAVASDHSMRETIDALDLKLGGLSR